MREIQSSTYIIDEQYCIYFSITIYDTMIFQSKSADNNAAVIQKDVKTPIFISRFTAKNLEK